MAPHCPAASPQPPLPSHRRSARCGGPAAESPGGPREIRDLPGEPENVFDAANRQKRESAAPRRKRPAQRAAGNRADSLDGGRETAPVRRGPPAGAVVDRPGP